MNENPFKILLTLHLHYRFKVVDMFLGIPVNHPENSESLIEIIMPVIKKFLHFIFPKFRAWHEYFG